MQGDPTDDGLDMPDIGAWGLGKYHFLDRYLRIFATSMRGKWSLHYVDLFAGAGYARLRSSKRIVKTSGLIASSLKPGFDGIHLCDADPANTSALKARLALIPTSNVVKIHTGDCNELIDSILAPIPRSGSLTVAFADPFGLHIRFSTIAKISKLRSDLIILFADNMDALRNWNTYYLENPNSPLDEFMGEPGWRQLLLNAPPTRRAQVLREKYQERLSTLGYGHFGHYRIANEAGADIYTLLYASANKLGLKFWKIATSKDQHGQMSFDID